MKIAFGVYTYGTMINAHFKARNVNEAKRVFLEMGGKGCSPNVVAYNVVIHGLYKVGCIDEAIEMKKSMVKKGLSLIVIHRRLLSIGIVGKRD
jgi:leucine-rich PPR motif-containing protein